eukprot:6451917-Karenia_brevis.AAC.1
MGAVTEPTEPDFMDGFLDVEKQNMVSMVFARILEQDNKFVKPMIPSLAKELALTEDAIIELVQYCISCNPDVDIIIDDNFAH